MEDKDTVQDICYSLRKVISFIISLIIVIIVSYVYLEGMLTLTMTGPETNIKVMAIKRGVLIAFHVDFNFRMVRNFFQRSFPIYEYIGISVALLSWGMGYLLLFFSN